jgi:hypothetical protein
MKMSFAATFLVLTMGGAVAAHAQGAMTPAVTGNFKEACSADVQRLCASAQTRKDQHKCIRQNRAQLSPGCSTFLAEKRAQHQQMKQQQGASGAPPAGGGE